MADEEKKPSGGLSIGSVSGENVKIVGGDNTEDNSKGKTHNEVHGDVGNLTSHQTNNFGGSLDEDLKNFFEEMKTKAPELTDEQENTSGGLPPRDIPSKEDPVVVPIEELEGLPAAKYVDNEDHPQMVYAAVQRQADPATPAPSPEEQKSLFQRFTSCVKKYATSDEAAALGQLVVAGIEATSSIAPPLNIINAVVKAGVNLKKK